MVEEKTNDAIPVFKLLVDSANKLIETCSSFNEFKGSLSHLESKIFVDRFAGLLYPAFVTADSIGRSNIVAKDKFYSDRKRVVSAKISMNNHFTRANSIDWISMDDSVVKISFNLTSTDALNSFKNKAFWISGIENQKFIDAIKSEIEKVISDGKTYNEFSDTFSDLFEKMGITAENPIKPLTIFRTNLFNSFTAGQLKQVDQMRDQFPVWRYSAVLDDRTRESHRVLNGKLFRNGPYPPIDYNCRCTPIFVHAFEGISEPVYESIYNFISPSDVIDFNGGSTFERWVDDNSVSSGIKNIIQDGVV